MSVPKHYSPPPIHEASPPTIRVLKHLLDMSPENADILAALGTVYLRNGDLERSVENLRAALKLSPQLSKIRTNLGIVLKLLGDEDGAEYHFREALLHDPKLEIATLELVAILIKRSEHDAALKMLERALLNRSSTDLNVQAGYCADALGQIDKAKSYYEKAINDENPMALAWLAEYDCKNGRDTILAGKLIEGIEILSKAYDRAPMVFTGGTKTVSLLSEISNLNTNELHDNSGYVSLLLKLLKIGIVWEVYSRKDQLESDAEIWKERIKKKGVYPYGYYRLGILQALQGGYMEALDSLDLCRAQLPAKKQAILKLAQVVDVISEIRDTE